MDDIDRLRAFTHAAEACNGLARQFVHHFGRPVRLSKDSWAATKQLRTLFHHAAIAASHIESVIERWEEHDEAQPLVRRAAATVTRLPPIYLDGGSFPTAHETAFRFAQLVVGCWSEIAGFSEEGQFHDDDFDECRDAWDGMVNRLANYSGQTDLYGHLQLELEGACSLLEEVDQPRAVPELVPSMESLDCADEEPRVVGCESDITAEFRDGGLATGQPLTVDFVSQSEKYGLNGPYLKKYYNGPRLKWGRKLVYRQEQIAALSDRKTRRALDADE